MANSRVQSSGRTWQRRAALLAACVVVWLCCWPAEVAFSAAGRRAAIGAFAAAGLMPQAASANHHEEYAVFKVELNGDKGGTDEIKVRLRPDWAPRGVKRFKKLVELGYLDDGAAYHVTPKMARFGLPAEPSLVPDVIKDDLRRAENTKGTLSFVQMKRNARSNELFFNMKHNANFDRQDIAPIGEVIEEDMEVLDKLYKGYSAAPNVQAIESSGNTYLERKFPKLSKFDSVSLSY
mmetsp:Transcript_43836/g.80056  ORF Transcript_43836/g.80056 Transcript_43836/m.80056 type:complete len:236 (-) Transcript_43836:52-759(-)